MIFILDFPFSNDVRKIITGEFLLGRNNESNIFKNLHDYGAKRLGVPTQLYRQKDQLP